MYLSLVSMVLCKSIATKLLKLLSAGAGFAYTKGLLPPAVSGALDGVLKKKAGGAAVGDGIYNKTVGDNDL